MGASQSTVKEPVIFYNPNVPLQFSHSLVGSIEKKAEQTAEKMEARHVESVVRQRVAEELEKIQQTQAELKESIYVDLTQTKAEKEVESEPITQMISRPMAKQVPENIKKYQDELMACYNQNKDKSLNCWKQVADFKQAVVEEQTKLVSSM
ncbi:uncharacterized protein B0P05DRAFT_540698 [Gilbertella persicaria]|uniref:uncharacterized protein n=1 Tax=Gilbertella persicaria TaxID=101096 RepID=UPI00221ECED5|nr:uncharacterized protein B0P05DRAFT_540698 [Gilbertella persicaria]KAI8080278.1 hypothetical protein B0P05DRAFT_540698 [Gilbertella persicaria]